MLTAINAGNGGVITALLSGVPNPQQLAEQGFKNSTFFLHAVEVGNVEIITAILAGIPNPQ